ncbi:hypothetical protein Gorai_008824 [Gossypium raimondii]|uniref:O-methyltransferase C-terminal domain-containing protein n=1 Tax=Gossypium raimondii TaxID=29730 RepID=A0A7J8PRJ6_GOSRA|nr:hypothetical protein [Gossypium raimondii]
MLVKAFPWIHGIHFDLPYVVAVGAKVDGVENIEGDMFECVPKAGTAFLMTWKGKERTLKEWKYVIGEAGFTRFNVEPIHAIQSVIEAYP